MNADRTFQWKRQVLRFSGAILAAGMAIAPGAMAKGQSKLGRANSVRVISHLEISGGRATRLQLVRQRKHQFLYITTSESSQPVVVDVTKPGKAHIVEPAQAAGANTATASNEVAENALETLPLLNANGPDAVGGHEFSKAARFLGDEKRGLIYVVDNDGLWIARVQTAIDEDAMRTATYYTP